MKRRIDLAAALVLAVALSLGSTTSSSATGDNPVVHWSGIARRRSPPVRRRRRFAHRRAARSWRRWCTAPLRRRRRDRRRLRAVRYGHLGPTGASIDAAVAQAVLDVLVARVTALVAYPSRARATRSWPPSRPGAPGRRQSRRRRRGGGHARAAHGRRIRRRRRPRPAVARTGVFELIAAGAFNPVPPPAAVDVKLARCARSPTTPAYRPDPPYALTSRACGGRSPSQQLGGATRRPARPRRRRPCGCSPTRPTCSTAAGCAPSTSVGSTCAVSAAPRLHMVSRSPTP